jgi:murein DD-endopeptidase MepM/ murein hydrolase activator NlpD
MTNSVSPVVGPMTVTQFFGERPAYYKKYGLAGHNGLDIRAKTGTRLWAMLPGVWELLTEKAWKYVRPWNPQGWYGYGAGWILNFGEGNGRVKRITFAHLQNRKKAFDGQNVPLYGQNTNAPIVMAETDNTGDSNAPHLHITVKQLMNGIVQNAGNGFKGAIDPLPWLKHELGIQFTNA